MKKYTEHGKLNIPKKKPHKTKARSIYRAVDNLATHGEPFLPTWDTTDHFHFACEHCHSAADVLAVEFVPRYPEVGATLFFQLGCPECGKTGQRIIYVEPRDAACKFQKTFTKGKVLLYSDKRKPYGEVQYRPVEQTE